MDRNNRLRPPLPALWLALGILIAAAGIAWAQAFIPFYVTQDVPTFRNAMLKLRAERSALMVFNRGTATAPDLDYMYQPAGRFLLRTATETPTGGNPIRDGDENLTVASSTIPYEETDWGGYFTSKFTIAIDPLSADPVFHDPHRLAEERGEVETMSDLLSFWPSDLSAGTRDITGVFRVPTVEIDNNDVPTEWITVRQLMTVIGDTVQFEYIVTNTSPQPHDVGMRLLIDATFGSGVYDGRAIVLPDKRVIENETTLPDPLRPNDIMPESWITYDNPQRPRVVLRGVLNGPEVNNPGIANSSGGVPDEISFGQWRNMAIDEQYDFIPNGYTSFLDEDWAYAVRWNAEALPAGQSRRYVTYYGLGSSAADYSSPYAFMAYAPYSLQSRSGDDPSTPDSVEQYYLVDDVGQSPFRIAAYMDNFSSAPLMDASVRIRLPLGLELASGESQTKSAGIIQRNEVKNVDWRIQANAARPGQAEIRFTGPRAKILTRTISIPAIPVLNPLPDAPMGLEMISIPYQFTDNDAEAVFASLGSLLAGGPASLIRFNPTRSEYRWFPDPSVTAITPGQGYWLLNRNREQVIMPDDARQLDASRVASVDIVAGWNQIGNPFTSSVRMDQIRVAGRYGGDWSLDEAVSRNMLLPTVYAYDPATNQYTWELLPSQTYLDPYMGYWLLARENCTLMFPPPNLYSPASASAAPAAAPTSGWKFDVAVSAPGMLPVTQTVAVRKNAMQGLDRYDVPQPPASVKQEDVYLRSAFYPGASGVGMPYLLDARGAGDARQEWNLLIKTNAANAPVTVSWPSLNSLPANLVATLVDDATGERRYMRTSSSYTLRTGAQGAERALRIVVQPRPANGLAVTGVQAAQTAAGASLSFALSADANVDVRVRNISGLVVSELAKDRPSVTGQNTLLWNGRSTRGSLVPNGRYLVEITARAADTGQAVTVVHPLQVKR